MSYPCDHCGQTCGDLAGGYGSLTRQDGSVVHLCHPSDPARPDCYRRLTVYYEPLGSLQQVDGKPGGVWGAAPWWEILNGNGKGRELERARLLAGPPQYELPRLEVDLDDLGNTKIRDFLRKAVAGARHAPVWITSGSGQCVGAVVTPEVAGRNAFRDVLAALISAGTQCPDCEAFRKNALALYHSGTPYPDPSALPAAFDAAVKRFHEVGHELSELCEVETLAPTAQTVLPPTSEGLSSSSTQRSTRDKGC